MSPITRAAGAADAAVLTALHSTSFARPWDAKAFAAFLADATCDVVIVDAPQPAGFILLRTVAGESEILTLAVDPARRRRGFAELLLRAALQRAAERGAQTCHLEVAADNTAAIGLYRKNQFQLSGIRRGYYPRDDNAIDAVTMRCDLGITSLQPT